MTREPYTFERVVLFVATMPNGDETLVGYLDPVTGNNPMISADELRYAQLAKKAQEMADKAGMPVRAVAFAKVGDRAVFLPTPGKKDPDIKQVVLNAPPDLVESIRQVAPSTAAVYDDTGRHHSKKYDA